MNLQIITVPNTSAFLRDFKAFKPGATMNPWCGAVGLLAGSFQKPFSCQQKVGTNNCRRMRRARKNSIIICRNDNSNLTGVNLLIKQDMDAVERATRWCWMNQCKFHVQTSIFLIMPDLPHILDPSSEIIPQKDRSLLIIAHDRNTIKIPCLNGCMSVGPQFSWKEQALLASHRQGKLELLTQGPNAVHHWPYLQEKKKKI